MLHKTLFAALTLGAAPAFAAPVPAVPAPAAPAAAPLEETISTWEQQLGGEIGVVLAGPNGKLNVDHSAAERFALSDAMAPLACGALLAKVDMEARELATEVEVAETDLAPRSPILEDRADESMTLGALCDAAISTGDETAARLVLENLGGPQELTGFLRWIGDTGTQMGRLDEGETSTPATVVGTLNTLLGGEALSEDSTRQLATWMSPVEVDPDDLPEGWSIRTGGGTDVRLTAALHPEQGPWIGGVFLPGGEAEAETRMEALEAITSALVRRMLGEDTPAPEAEVSQ